MEPSSPTPIEKFTSSFEKKFEEDWNCTICLEIVKNPHLIRNCLHIFCKACIDMNTDRSPTPDCPVCREKYRKTDITYAYMINNQLDRIWRKQFNKETTKEAISKNEIVCRNKCNELYGKTYTEEQFKELYWKNYDVNALINPYSVLTPKMIREKLKKCPETGKKELLKKIAENYELAVSRGDNEAKFYFAKFISKNRENLPRKYCSQPFELLKEAASNDYLPAVKKLINDTRVCSKNIIGYLRQAARLGDVESMRRLGEMYERGDWGVKKDSERAKMWRLKAKESR